MSDTMRSENLKSIVAAGSAGMTVLAERAGAFSSLPNSGAAQEVAFLVGVGVGEGLRQHTEFDPLFDEIDHTINKEKLTKGLVAGLGAWGMHRGMEPMVANAMLGVGVTSTIYAASRAQEKAINIYSGYKEKMAARKERRAEKKKNKEEK